MAQISANPWSFFGPADQAATQPIASITNQGRSALVTTVGAHGLQANQPISIQDYPAPAGSAGTDPPYVSGYAGGYKIISVPSTTTLLIQAEMFETLGNVGAVGNVLTAAYLFEIRAEQILWSGQNPGDVLTLTDVAGNLVYNVKAPLTAAEGPFTYGKVFWIHGLVINSFPSGIIQITIN